MTIKGERSGECWEKVSNGSSLRSRLWSNPQAGGEVKGG